MTRRALGRKLALVGIFMTIDAFHFKPAQFGGRELFPGGYMTLLASHFRMFARQGIFRVFVVVKDQTVFLPTHSRMARGALLGKLPLVRVFMTAAAVPRHPFEQGCAQVRSSRLRFMALGALLPGVLAFQMPGRIGIMGEEEFLPGPTVAGMAFIASGDELGLVDVGMAIGAGLILQAEIITRRIGRPFFLMALVALQFGMFTREFIDRQIVVKLLPVHFLGGDDRLAGIIGVFLVTGSAITF